jgi:hypothetical protein
MFTAMLTSISATLMTMYKTIFVKQFQVNKSARGFIFEYLPTSRTLHVSPVLVRAANLIHIRKT